MLALVAPEAFYGRPVDSLQRKYDRQRTVWDRLNFTRQFVEAVASEGRELEYDEMAFVAEEWEGLIDGDAFFNDLLERIRAGNAEAVSDLVGYIQEFHRLDHRIVRTRRATLDDAATPWPARELIELDWCPSQAEAIFLNHLADLPPATNQSDVGLRTLYQRFCSTSAASTLRFLQQRQSALDHVPAVAFGDSITRISADPGPNDEPILIADLVSSLPQLHNEQLC
jgi:ATP-dependent helicase HepA